MTGIISDNVGRTSGLIKAASGGGGGVWTKIKTLTSDGSDATLSFVDGTSDVVLDSTYPMYVFKFINIHPETDEAYLTFQASTDTGSSYGVTLMSSFFYAKHNEADDTATLSYDTGSDLSQSTDFHKISQGIGNGNDECCSGEIWLFSPSNTTFVKHFTSRSNTYEASNMSQNVFTSGYFNTTSAVDAIQFKMTADEIQGGKIKLYGISDS